MVRREIWLLILLCSCVVSLAKDKPAANPAERWEDTIRQFEHPDVADPRVFRWLGRN